MQINIGTKNPVKVSALQEIIKEYAHLADAEIVPCDVSSDVSDQPKSLEETIIGATNRAKNAFKDCVYSFGIESGLMSVPSTKSGLMDVCVCAIYDGSELHLGLSSAWEVPQSVTNLMINDGLNMTDAALQAGYSTNPKLGSAEGLIGIVTKGRLTRNAYTKESIRTALIHIDPV